MTQAQVETHGWPPGTGWRGNTLIATYDDRTLGSVWSVDQHTPDLLDLSRVLRRTVYYSCRDADDIEVGRGLTLDQARRALVAALRERGLLPSP